MPAAPKANVTVPRAVPKQVESVPEMVSIGACLCVRLRQMPERCAQCAIPGPLLQQREQTALVGVGLWCREAGAECAEGGGSARTVHIIIIIIIFIAPPSTLTSREHIHVCSDV